MDRLLNASGICVILIFILCSQVEAKTSLSCLTQCIDKYPSWKKAKKLKRCVKNCTNSGRKEFEHPIWCQSWQRDLQRPSLNTPEDILGIVQELIKEQFPTLHLINIELKEMADNESYFKANFVWNTWSKDPIKRIYRLWYSRNVLQKEKPLSYIAAKAVIAHELQHLQDYTGMKRLEILRLGMKYLREFAKSYEKSTDAKIVYLGHALGMKEYRLWQFQFLTKKQIKRKKQYYLSPQELNTFIPKCPELNAK